MPGPPIVPPAGVTAATTFAPVQLVAAQPPPVILARKLDPTSGEVLSLFQGRSPALALLIEQLRVVNATGAAVQNSGNRFATIRQNDAAAPGAIEAEMRRILDPMVSAGLIELDSIDVEAGPSMGDLGATFATFRDLTDPAPGASYTLGITPEGAVSLGPSVTP